MDVPIWIIALGGVSIVVGLAVLGSRVIQTMGML
jgi:phosphate/sulfate permease